MDPRWQDALVAQAQRNLSADVFRYFSAGASDELTASEAASAWRRLRFQPRVLTDVRAPDLSTTLLGQRFPSPIGIAPTSMQKLADPAGEVAMARAAAAADALLVLSGNSGATYAEVGATGVRWWLQTYLTSDRTMAERPLAAAVEAGAQAIVLTVDTPRPGDKRGVDLADLGDLSGVYGSNYASADRALAGAEHAADLGPDDIAWLAEQTGLPVAVKGVLRADDAVRCVEAGAAAIWVSNHGGRQLDRAISTADALPWVVDAVGERAEVYVDGGINSGLDVLAALGLGASAAFVGRLPVYGLAAYGESGVRRVLTNLHLELGEAMALSGSQTLDSTRQLAVSNPQNRF